MRDVDAPLLVLGAGPTGLAVAKALGERGLAYEQVEASDEVGGNWSHGVYETAHIISSRLTTQYDDYPMPASYPDFPSAAQMAAYFKEYCDTFDLRRHIRFRTKVVAVTPVEGARGWEVRFEDGVTKVYRGVLVCNGHHWAKTLPAWAADAGCEVLHSKDYKRPDQLRGRRVLVVGGGNSGCDIVSEAARVGASASWSLRRGYWFMPKTLWGKPSVEFVSPWMPVFVQRWVMGLLAPLLLGRYQDYGLPAPDHRLFEAHPTVNTEVFHYLQHGKITVRKDVLSARQGVITYADGAEEAVDLVVCATGYDLSFPFLAPGTVPVVGKTPQLYAGLVRPEHRHLYIVGGFQPRYGVGPLLRPLAMLLAELVALQDELTVPLGELLRRLGDKPPTTHLVDPHEAMRRMRWARRAMPLMRWRARRLGLLAQPG
ncbi:NAD(P)-binding domain-containing protein [Myxococcota bacterium]|nr:NAD(P)-binding domain-containing protein [Myxococcota bacterium]